MTAGFEEKFQSLQESLVQERTGRKGDELAKLIAEEHAVNLQQSIDEEKAGRETEKLARHEAEKLAQTLQQALAEERSSKKETEDAKMWTQQLAEGLQHMLVEEQQARKDAEAAKQCAHDAAESIRKKYEEELEAARQEAESKVHESQEALQAATSSVETLSHELAVAKERAAKAEQLASDMQRSKAAMPRYSASVHMIEDSPLTLGIEAEEDAAAHGDVTKEMADLVSSYGATQVFRVGRIRLPASFSEVAPACARVAVKNDGPTRWPQTSVIVHVDGDNFGLQVMALGVLEPGHTKEIEMDLAVAPRNSAAQQEKRIYRP